jgi:protein-S-isoprenylcysteine O-methyltransferase Ste14
MNIKLIIIFSFTLLYGFFEIFLNQTKNRKSHIEKKDDRGSLIGLYLSISIGYFLAFTFASLKPGRIYHWDLMFIAGFTLIAIGLIIRISALLALKQYFTYSVAKIEEHKLVTIGLYKRIRHPGYLGQLIIFLGISVSLSNWLTIILMMLSVLIGYNYRIMVEEKFMSEQMGEKYNEYKMRTKKLIPWIF